VKKLLAVLVFAVFFTGTLALRQTSTPEERYVAVVQRVLPTAVTIYVQVSRPNPDNPDEIQHGHLTGSGVFISRYGHILTCNHLFSSEFKIEGVEVETYEHWPLPATVIYQDPKKDLALVKVDDTYAVPAVLARPDSPEVGQEVIAIGAPLGLTSTVTTGIISATNRDDLHYDMIQMSAPINPGNSGGPLFNLKGELVGINTNVISIVPIPIWTGLGFAVSASEINRFLYTFKGLDKIIK